MYVGVSVLLSDCGFVVSPANVSLLLRHMFEQHKASNPVEDLVKGAASGDVGKVDQLLSAEECNVNDQFNGRTALQAASQNGHIDVVGCLIRHKANLEETVLIVTTCATIVGSHGLPCISKHGLCTLTLR